VLQGTIECGNNQLCAIAQEHRRFARRVAGLALMFFGWGVTAFALRAARSPQQPSQDQLQLWAGALSRCRTLCNAQHCRTRWAAGSAPAPERAAPLRAGCGGFALECHKHSSLNGVRQRQTHIWQLVPFSFGF